MRNSQESTPLLRLRFTLGLLFAVVLAGAVGYHLLAGTNYIDSFYMAITTLFTVGFREMGQVTNATKLFTIFYLVTGLGVATYAISSLTALIVEGDLQGYLRERRMEKQLKDFNDHVIVCGFGKVGVQVVLELQHSGIPIVVIDVNENRSKDPILEEAIFLHGNAMDERLLERAGIDRARGLISTLDSDANNVLVTLTAKQLAPGVPVVVRAAFRSSESKLKAAGADHIVSPYEIGGRRMACMLLTPELMNYVDVVVDSKQTEMALEHILVRPDTALVGITMREARLRDTTGALIVGIHKPGEGLLFNPKGSERFDAGDVILAMGPHKALGALRLLAKGEAKLGG